MIRFEDILDKSRGLQPAVRPGPAPAGVRLLGARAQGAGPPLGRAVPRPSAQRRLDPRRHEGRRRLDRRRTASRRARGHADDQGGDRAAVRRRGRRARRRTDQDRQVLLRLARGGAGGDLPQDDPRDGVGPAGRPREARGPAPQHAHPPVPAGGKAPRDRARDPRHLRPDREPPRNGPREGRARGPRVHAPRARRLRARRARGRAADEGLRGDDREGARAALRGASSPKRRSPAKSPAG